MKMTKTNVKKRVKELTPIAQVKFAALSNSEQEFLIAMTEEVTI
jgi:hypothetical protein